MEWGMASNQRPTIQAPLPSASQLDLSRKTALPKRPSLTTKKLAVDLKDIKAIIDLMRKNDLSVFELEKDGFKLKLQKGPSNGQPIITAPIALPPPWPAHHGVAMPGEAGGSPAAEHSAGTQGNCLSDGRHFLPRSVTRIAALCRYWQRR